MTSGGTDSRQDGRGAARLVVFAVILIFLAGCSADAASDSNGQGNSRQGIPQPVQPDRSEKTRAEVAEQRASTAYVEMWQDFAAAATTSDWRSERLADHATGKALDAMSRALYADRRNGIVTKGMPKNDPDVTSSRPAGDPSTVMISDCGDSSEWLTYDADTGKLSDDEPGGKRLIVAEVKKQDDNAWKVTRFAVDEIGTC